MFFLRRKKPRVAVKRPRPRSLGLEALEGRDLLSAAPVLFKTLSESLDFADTPALAPSSATSRQLATLFTSPMMESRVEGRLSNGTDVDVVKVRLEEGQIFTAYADFTPFGTQIFSSVAPRLTLFDSAGQTLVQGGEQGIGFRVVNSGDYFVGLASTARTSDPASYGAKYTLHVRPIGLAGDDLDPIWLRKAEGGIYVWQNDDELYVSGPVGHGFSIRGDWYHSTSTSNGQQYSRYESLANLVYIQTSAGVEIPLYLDEYGMVLTTAPGKFGNLYGELTSSGIWATSEFVQGIARKFGDESPFGMQLDAQNMPITLGEIGLKLGNDPLLSATGAPLNPAVPYLYVDLSLGVNATYEGTFAGVTYSFGSLVVDPADPFAYFSCDYGNMEHEYGVGLSHQGLIPFIPEKDPSQFNGQLFGHVYVSGQFSLGGLPLSIDGNVVLNLNGHGTGRVNEQTLAEMGSVSSALTSKDDHGALENYDGGTSPATESSPLWRNFSIGINGNVNFLLPIQDMVGGGLALLPGVTWFANHPKTEMASEFLLYFLSNEHPLTLASATLVYDGPNGGLYFRGGTHDMLDGSKWAFLTSGMTKFDVDVAWVEGGHFFLDASGEFGTLPRLEGRLLLARNFDLKPELAALITGNTSTTGTLVTTTGGYVELDVNVLGSGIRLVGRVQGNGDFELVGSAGVNLGLANASVNVKYRYSRADGITYTADLAGSIRIDDVTRASLSIHFRLGMDSQGRTTYAGSGTAKVEVKVPKISPKGVKWEWETAASCSIGVSNEEFWFSFAGKKYKTALPH